MIARKSGCNATAEQNGEGWSDTDSSRISAGVDPLIRNAESCPDLSACITISRAGGVPRHGDPFPREQLASEPGRQFVMPPGCGGRTESGSFVVVHIQPFVDEAGVVQSDRRLSHSAAVI